jgi:hypothetical protein
MDKSITYYEWPRWMKIKEAALYSSIGQKRLIELTNNKIIIGFQDPDHGHNHWIFDRLSLDEYRNAQAAISKSGSVRAKALDILKAV